MPQTRMVDPITVWHNDHRRFARLLHFLEREMAAFETGKEPDYELMRDVVRYLGHVGDRVHHPMEDVAFARLLERDGSLGPAVERLEQEHRVIAAAGDALVTHLDNILKDVVVERQAVETAARTYIVCYRNHLETEEEVIIPRAAKVLKAADWAALAKAAQPLTDPLFGDAGERYWALCERIAAVA